MISWKGEYLQSNWPTLKQIDKRLPMAKSTNSKIVFVVKSGDFLACILLTGPVT